MVVPGTDSTTRYRVPSSANVEAPVVMLVPVAPAMSTKLVELGAAFCHWYVGAAEPVALTVNVAVWPKARLAS